MLILILISVTLLIIKAFLIFQIVQCLRKHPEDTLETHEKYISARLDAMKIVTILLGAALIALIFVR